MVRLFITKISLLCVALCLLFFIESCVVGGTSNKGCTKDVDCIPGQTCVAEKCISSVQRDAGPTEQPTPDNKPQDNTTSPPEREMSSPDPLPTELPDSSQEQKLQEVPIDSPCQGNASRECGQDVGTCKKGTQQCKDGQWGPCDGEVRPEFEYCDDKDNDCDGQIDEDFPNKGQECQSGMGSCANKGKWLCKQKQLECDAIPGQPTTEICDGQDNDCNGQVDELPECGLRKGRFALTSGGALMSSTGYKLVGTLSPAPQVKETSLKSTNYQLKLDFAPGRKP